jgi:hypothetical protein
MTYKEAKELSLEVWRYLAAHPELTDKVQLPDDLYVKICGLSERCPLCEVLSFRCQWCPLGGEGYRCAEDTRPYQRWVYSVSSDVRREAATEIVRLIEAWNVGEE